MALYNQDMNAETSRRLLEINQQFYTWSGAQFSATRQRIQPGVRKILPVLLGCERILDVGCGNGELARALAQNGFTGAYTGLDFSLPLLADARSQPGGMATVFFKEDITTPDWDLRLGSAPFAAITAFAVLHHIPRIDLRLAILEKIHNLLEPGGKFIHSHWQFLNSEKLKNRIQPWQAVGLSSADVDAGDFLLDWRAGKTGFRYVHHFSQNELDELAAMTGFKVVDSFLSDGEGGKLGLYQIWERNEN